MFSARRLGEAVPDKRAVEIRAAPRKLRRRMIEKLLSTRLNPNFWLCIYVRSCIRGFIFNPCTWLICYCVYVTLLYIRSFRLVFLRIYVSLV